ncbi:MAG: FAD:protein FMN transferase [Ilumatobacteraceae bacterium]|nr:FAD:protein FMN transferase [Ilumatobacteraceae bacterium]
MMSAEARIKFAGKSMGTVVSVHIDDSISHESAKDAWSSVCSFLRDLENRFSTFLPTSEISRINSGELHVLDASPDMVEVLDTCTWLEHLSSGVFNARRPDGLLDPAGFVKGWAAERAARLLLEAGLKNYYLRIGGDIQTHGLQSTGEKWRVGIVDPHDASRIRSYVDIPENWAVATSGTAERGQHIWGKDSLAVNAQFSSMTVIGPHLMWADAFATIGFALGGAGIEWVEKFPDYTAFTLS